MGFVLDRNEVLLYGRRLPIRGPVQPVLISVFPQKVVFGDFTKDNKQLTSSWIMDDWTGGCGKRILDTTTDTDRFDFATLETRYRKQLTLPPEAIEAGGVAGKDDLVTGAEFNNEQYLVFDNAVVKWDAVAGRLSDPLYSLPHSATDAVAYRLAAGVNASQTWLFIASGDEITSFDGLAWNTVAGAGYFKYLCVWDDKLFAIGTNGKLRFTQDGASWTDAATLPLPIDSVTGLLVYFLPDGNTAVHIVTKQGIYVYDATALTIRSTKFLVPRYKYGGLGNTEWRGFLYYGSGLDVFEFGITTLSPMGLGRDYGLPQEYKGNIVKLVPSLSWLYALLDVTTTNAPSLAGMFPCDPFSAEVLNTSSGMGLLMAWNGRGWHAVYVPDVENRGMKWAGSSSANDSYRLWFGSNGKAYYIDMTTSVANPLYNPTQRFAKRGYLISGWFDAGWSELEKLALSLRVGVKQATSSETIRISYGFNDSPLWYPLGTFTEKGVHEIRFPGQLPEEQGVPFYNVRFLIEMERGDDPTRTPVLDFLAFEYLKTLDAQWGYSFVVDATKPYKGLSPREIVQFLEEIASKKPLGEMAFRDSADEVVTRFVKLTRMAGFAFTGTDERGYFQVSVARL